MIYPDIPDRTLSITQPWTFLIAHRFKRIENRSRRCHVRGEIALHAGLKFDEGARRDVEAGVHPVTGERSLLGIGPADSLMEMLAGKLCGGIVGVAELVDCVDESEDDFFVGPFGLVLRNARPVPFIPVTGAQGFFFWRKQWEKDQAKLRAAA